MSTAVTASEAPLVPQYTKRDFVSDQTVRWCPGCGDYAILDGVQKVFATLGIPRENFVVVSGIGCSSRLPYYINTFGFHSIHGRAPAVATGIKVTRPELSVWVATGDGDGLSIGGNHLLHAMRRNIDLKILLFNNRIYGLTKGQYSPTSEAGKKTKTSPYGSVDQPMDPIALALASGATFVARAVDVYGDHLRQILTRAAHHRGAVFIEILQNCPIFNDGTFAEVENRQERPEHALELEHGQPLRFGRNRQRGIRLRQNFRPEVVETGEGNTNEEELLRHDETNPALSYLLCQLQQPEFPVPIGVFRAVETESYEAAVHRQIAEAKAARKPGTLDGLLRQGDIWEAAGPRA
ncbi:MAG: 2-oxoacid:ferredoxin oxidoreductase subunit beta [Bryobacterales bacterium]|nr:2-oxoacid:ferredoxin oxidoreductase subunit beta [Bryobacterales bacterium]